MVQILSISLPGGVITTESRLDQFFNRMSIIRAEKRANGAGLMGISLFGWELHFGRDCMSIHSPDIAVSVETNSYVLLFISSTCT
jgi:hypothetical protein